ncbi:hypothetical protein Bbelb_341540 [Branchiostoma belcheri]|nr:hypothetical protein Bbelb_341540 [Branchiostoma belcheri]
MPLDPPCKPHAYGARLAPTALEVPSSSTKNPPIQNPGHGHVKEVDTQSSQVSRPPTGHPELSGQTSPWRYHRKTAARRRASVAEVVYTLKKSVVQNAQCGAACVHASFYAQHI